MGSIRSVFAGALAFVAILSVFAMPADALNRSGGDYWVYEGTMDVEGVPVDGTFRYEFEKEDTLTIGTEVFEVNVMKITGSLSGTTDDLLGMSASVQATFDGKTYETRDGFGTVKEDMYLWINMTFGTGSFSLVMRMELQDVSIYSPPSFSGFDEDETGTGDQWEETVNVTSTSVVWVDDVIDESSSESYEETYQYSVAATEDRPVTEAGTFDCLKITSTDSEGNYRVNWYSHEVGNYVKMSYFDLGESSPYLSLELSEYKYSKDSALVMTLIIGVGILVVVAIIVVALLLMRKRGQTPAQAPPQPPVPPPSQ